MTIVSYPRVIETKKKKQTERSLMREKFRQDLRSTRDRKKRREMVRARARMQQSSTLNAKYSLHKPYQNRQENARAKKFAGAPPCAS